MATPPPPSSPSPATRKSAAAKRKRKPQVSTAPRLQTKTLLASTRDELRAVQADLEELVEARRLLLQEGAKPTLGLVAPKRS
ncbi:hypothetical protein PINS_up005156 [Pythium insidiosum]|nr:hypothetical protein PINS_up005156 [Pythium insidiosum]